VTPTVVVVSLVAVYLAFRAGSRWRHHRRTWSDHKAAKVATKKLGKTRWGVLRVALLAVLALLIYETAITVATAVSNVGDFLHGPKPVQSTQPAGVPSHR
jgi:hypothetical protein